MGGIQVLTLGGMVAAAGLVWLVAALRPARPVLAEALADLSGATAAQAPVRFGGAAALLPAPWMARAAARLRRHASVPPEDLAILGVSAEEIVARRIGLALGGLVLPAVMSVALAALGLSLVAGLPALAGLAVAAVGWWLPASDTRERAGRARAEFRVNLEFFLTLVAGERRARGSVEEALSAAAAVSGTPAFSMLRREITRAELSGQRPWVALKDLGRRIGVVELSTAADIAASAADGAAVYLTLLAAARTLRGAQRAAARTEANLVSERMSRPLSTLVMGLVLFVLVPFFVGMFAQV